jgi:hypothetical protein
MAEDFSGSPESGQENWIDLVRKILQAATPDRLNQKQKEAYHGLSRRRQILLLLHQKEVEEEVLPIVEEALARRLNKKEFHQIIESLQPWEDEIPESLPPSLLVKKGWIDRYDSFLIHGDPESRDLDICCLIDPAEDITLPVSKEFEHRLRDEVNEFLQLDQGKQLDINIIQVENGDIVRSKKGNPVDTQNIIYYTYQFHQQKYPNPLNRPPLSNLGLKQLAIEKFIIDYTEEFLGKETYLRDKKVRKDVYTDLPRRSAYARSLIPRLMEIVPNLENQRLLEAMKSLTFKLLQFHLIDHSINPDYYRKRGIIDLFCSTQMSSSPTASSQSQSQSQSHLDEIANELQFLLFRGTEGSWSGTIWKSLLESYLSRS